MATISSRMSVMAIQEGNQATILTNHQNQLGRTILMHGASGLIKIHPKLAKMSP
jgi:hypothetical protein